MSDPGAPDADPRVARRDDLVEVLHGVEVADPYRWMEELGSPELRRWVDAVADEADAVLAALPGRAALRATLEQVTDVPRGGAPWRRGATWFHMRNTGLQDHAVLWSAPADDGAAVPGAAPTEGWTVLLDPNGWEGARSLGPLSASPDGRLVAYAVSEAGSDWQTWHVLDVRTGERLDDTVPWSRFAGAAWLEDGTGFLTCTYDAPTEGQEHASAVRGQRVVLHALGGATTVVHERPDDDELGFEAAVTHDGAWLVVGMWRGTNPETGVAVAPITADGIGEVRTLLPPDVAQWSPFGVVGDELWCRTDLDAPRGRVVAVRLDDGEARREVLAEADDQLEEVRLAGGFAPGDDGWLVTAHLRHAASVVTVHDLDGTPLHEVDLGPLCSAGESAGGSVTTSRRDASVHVLVVGYDTPARLLRHDLPAGTTQLLSSATLTPVTGPGDDGAGLAPMVVTRVFVASDAVRVPVFLLHRTDVLPDGARPTILYGYGGFNIPMAPRFRPAWRAWVERGGVYAIACLRGGGEYGRAWYDDGRLGNKQHVFDDALAVAAWLCGESDQPALDDAGAPVAGPAWTSRDHLGVEGASNGGLLAAACLTQAPDRFASVVPEVGVHDLLRFHLFTIGWAWTSDYGDPATPEGFRDAYAYSPLHNVVDGTRYPPTLITTADTDDRVVPSHSFKLFATLRHAQGGDAPVLLRVDRSAGHGAGKPTSQLLDERADVLAWHALHLGLPLG